MIEKILFINDYGIPILYFKEITLERALKDQFEIKIWCGTLTKLFLLKVPKFK